MNFLACAPTHDVASREHGTYQPPAGAIGLERIQLLYNPGAVLLGMTYNFLPFIDTAHLYGASEDRLRRCLRRPAIGRERIWRFPQGHTAAFSPGHTLGHRNGIHAGSHYVRHIAPAGGGQYMMFGDLIQNQFLFVGDWHFGSALSLIMMALILLSMAVHEPIQPGCRKEAAALKILRRLYLGLILLFLVRSILILVAFSFSSGESRANWGHFTLEWYRRLFYSAEIMQALRTTVLVRRAGDAHIYGSSARWPLSAYLDISGRCAGLILNITYLPILNPDIVTGVSLMILFVFMKMRLDLSLCS